MIVVDRRQQPSGAAFRTPVLAVALGIYLPLKLSAAIFLGGLVAMLGQRTRSHSEEGMARGGLLFAAGLITGEALMGILLALPIALSSLWPAFGADPLTMFAEPPLGAWPGVAVMAGVAALLLRSTRR